MGTVLGPRPPWDESKEPILRAPRAVIVCLALLIIVHVGTLFLSDAQFESFIATFALFPDQVAQFGWGDVGFNLKTLLTFAPFITYAFLHADFLHLIFNSVWFLIFATAVARRIGTGRFLRLSFITAVVAALTHLAFHWGSPSPVVGASGIVSGLMGASFRFILIDPATTPVWPPARLPLFSRPVMTWSAVWILLNIVLGVTGFTPEGFGRVIAWEAHIGGFLAGLLFFPLFDRQRSWIS
jgi:membrane associated rhomboid family serine protease